MRLGILNLLFIVFLFSCQTKPNTPLNIKGDWVGKKDSSDDANKRPVFSFNDSTGKLHVPWTDEIRYSVKANKVYIYRGTDSTEYKMSDTFTILKINNDSLILKNDKDSIHQLIQLRKIQPQNYIRPSKIYFVSSGCFGSCPSMFLEIDSLGKLIFDGKLYTKDIGFYSTQLTSSVYNTILQKIQNIKLDSLKRNYEANWSDDQTCEIHILTGHKEFITTVYGYDKEPIELRILINYLMELYEHVNLKRYSPSQTASFLKNAEFQKLMPDLSAPPPIPKKSFNNQ